ncbi:chitobiase/beta-hexosaminidase C-terminal domain-containing protein [Methanocella arvoryzae]|uniref:GH29D-like beta-sandwich domain-containing protein n=1 Tax=Methanocella arvoryzae (strain DSM 22066 / NBRC 105507 / MRE50) TaxID=351160 RepID=Q0W6D5_METAR|nr:chitobiase/beta-hexosaminidase C-terminal domain-containing protein [Methanocella arvoryzae]CAJ36058.1 hypothetical protein RCIX659 [Methanocella arvoryzae MRE50]
MIAASALFAAPALADFPKSSDIQFSQSNYDVYELANGNDVTVRITVTINDLDLDDDERYRVHINTDQRTALRDEDRYGQRDYVPYWEHDYRYLEFTSADNGAIAQKHFDVTVHSNTVDDAATEYFVVEMRGYWKGYKTLIGWIYPDYDSFKNIKRSNVTIYDADTTAPITTATASGTSGANGWYTSIVQVTLTASDEDSGVANTYYTIDGGAQQTYSAPFTVTDGTHTIQYWSVDKAGNTETAQTLNLNVDTKAPVITSDRTPANANGWNNGDVTVSFTATDDGSGISGSASYSQTLTGEGSSQSVEWSVTDLAGNTANATVSNINIDKTAPSITGAVDRDANANGWYNADVTVTFTAGADLSGIASITDPVVLGEGAGQSVTGTVVDLAGNSASTTVSGINVDKTAPVLVSSGPTTSPNINGWYNGDVTVNFVGSDALSGISGSTSADVVVSTEGADEVASYTFTDKAGNSATFYVTGIKLDKTAPVITTARTPANANGWNNGPVTVSFTATDAGSGIDGDATYEETVAGDGEDQEASWSVSDLAGNSASATVGGINIDTAAPTTTDDLTGTLGNDGWFLTDVHVTLSATDGAAFQAVSGSGLLLLAAGSSDEGSSGIAEIWYTLDGSAPIAYPDGGFDVTGNGQHVITFWSVDAAGNAEEPNTDNFKIDKDAPVTTFSVTGAEVTLDAADNIDGSGVAATYYTLNGGLTQTYIGSFPLPDGTYTIEFWSEDVAGNVELHGDGLNTETFTVETVQSYTIHLLTGWNLVSSPLIIEPMRASDIVGNGITMVAKYNKDTGEFTIYSMEINQPGDPEDFVVTNDVGYYFAASQDMDYTFVGVYAPVPYSIDVPGDNRWDIYGWTSLQSSTAYEVASLMDGMQMIAVYNHDTGGFTIFSEEINTVQDAENFVMGPGVGYFITSDTTTTLAYEVPV